MSRYGKTVAKILELFATGFLLGVVRDREGRRKLLSQADDIFGTIDRKQFHYLVKKFKLAGLIKTQRVSKDKEKITLTLFGRTRLQAYKFHNLKLKSPKKKWDKKWRMVLFDIPEVKRKARDALRKKLKQLGFLEFQKSVFIFPYPCEDEINFLINFFDISEHVYYLGTEITPDSEFRAHFQLK